MFLSIPNYIMHAVSHCGIDIKGVTRGRRRLLELQCFTRIICVTSRSSGGHDRLCLPPPLDARERMAFRWLVRQACHDSRHVDREFTIRLSRGSRRRAREPAGALALFGAGVPIVILCLKPPRLLRVLDGPTTRRGFTRTCRPVKNALRQPVS